MAEKGSRSWSSSMISTVTTAPTDHTASTMIWLFISALIKSPLQRAAHETRIVVRNSELRRAVSPWSHCASSTLPPSHGAGRWARIGAPWKRRVLAVTLLVGSHVEKLESKWSVTRKHL